MKSKKRFSFYLILTIVLSLLYIIFAIKPLGSEYQLNPEWRIDVARPETKENTENKTTHAFKLGQSLGYFTDDGKITAFETFPFKASVSDNYYAIFNSYNQVCDFFTPDRKKAGTIKVPGFPMFQDNKIFVFLPGGTSFVQCNEDGSVKWQYDSPSPVTVFQNNGENTIAGFADGNLVQFDKNGKIVQSFAPGGSDFPVIAGAAISNSGKYIASVSGRSRQRFTLSKKEDSKTKIIFHEFVDKDDARQQLVKFSGDDKYVIYTTKEYAGIVDILNEKSLHIPIKGHAINLKEAGNNFILLTKESNSYSIYIVERFASLIGSFTFEAKHAFIDTCGGDLYIGKNSSISKIKLTKE